MFTALLSFRYVRDGSTLIVSLSFVNLDPFWMHSPDPKLCQVACMNDLNCMAWTYVKPGVQGEGAHCWLKDQVPDPTEDENCISGVRAKRHERGAHRPKISTSGQIR